MSDFDPVPWPLFRDVTPAGRPPRVLFVSHQADRTGAPLMLWRFLRWVRQHTSLWFEVLVLEDGPMVAEFESLAPTHVVHLDGPPADSAEARLRQLRRHAMADRVRGARMHREVQELRGFDVLYLNSALSTRAFGILPEVPPIVISHLHELDAGLRYWLPDDLRGALVERTDWFITVAAAVNDILVGAYGVESSRLRTHHGFIDPMPADAEAARAARRRLGIPADAVVVGAVGTATWRKGADLFVQVAADVLRRRSDLDVHFVWVGAADRWGDDPPVEEDIARFGIGDRVHFMGEYSSPGEAYGLLDLFLLTSREDPFPLVMLEAAAYGIPVVSFDNGGVRELATAGDDPACPLVEVVPALDVTAMAATTMRLIDDEPARKELGTRGADHIVANHFTDVAAPRLYAELGRISPVFD